MKNIFLFPGQRAQFQGMMMDLYESSSMEKKTIDKFSEISGENIVTLLRDTDISVLSRTDKSQLAITAASLAMVAALKEKGIEPEAVAGFSLGEFSALCVSGILSFEDTVKIVKVRGEIMQKVCDEIAEKALEGEKPEPSLSRSSTSFTMLCCSLLSSRSSMRCFRVSRSQPTPIFSVSYRGVRLPG